MQLINYTGDYKDRQQAAIKDGCDLYLEQHMNSTQNFRINYGLAIYVPRIKTANDSKTAGKYYCEELAKRVDWTCTISSTLSYGRAIANIGIVAEVMPALVLEPCFVSNTEIAKWLNNNFQETTDLFSQIIIDTLKRLNYQKVALSMGHYGKISSPNDKGALSVVGFNENGGKVYGLPEAHFNKTIIEKVMAKGV